MATLQLYASLCVVLNGQLLHEQCAVNIYDRVNQPCRVTVSSALPDKGPEVEARTRLGERVKLSVHTLDKKTRTAGVELLTIEGPIVEALTSQPTPDCWVETTFVVENQPLPVAEPDDEEP